MADDTPDWGDVHESLVSGLTNDAIMSQHPDLDTTRPPQKRGEFVSAPKPIPFKGDSSINQYANDAGAAYRKGMSAAGVPDEEIDKFQPTVEALVKQKARRFAIQKLMPTSTGSEEVFRNAPFKTPGFGHLGSYARSRYEAEAAKKLEEGTADFRHYRDAADAIHRQEEAKKRGESPLGVASLFDKALGLGQFAGDVALGGGLAGGATAALAGGTKLGVALGGGTRLGQAAAWGFGATAAMPQRILGEYAERSEPRMGLDEQGNLVIAKDESSVTAKLWKSTLSNYIDNSIMPGVAGIFSKTGTKGAMYELTKTLKQEGGGYPLAVLKKTLMALAGAEAAGDAKYWAGLSTSGGPFAEFGAAIGSGDTERMKRAAQGLASDAIVFGALESIVQAGHRGESVDKSAKKLAEEILKRDAQRSAEATSAGQPGVVPPPEPPGTPPAAPPGPATPPAGQLPPLTPPQAPVSQPGVIAGPQKPARIQYRGQEYADTPRIRGLIQKATDIESALPPVPADHVRLWRGNRPGEEGSSPSFTNSLPGIALPFQEGYGGKLTYVDVPIADAGKYEQKGAVAPGSEFILPASLAKQAKDATGPQKPVETGPKAVFADWPVQDVVDLAKRQGFTSIEGMTKQKENKKGEKTESDEDYKSRLVKMMVRKWGEPMLRQIEEAAKPAPPAEAKPEEPPEAVKPEAVKEPEGKSAEESPPAPALPAPKPEEVAGEEPPPAEPPAGPELQKRFDAGKLSPLEQHILRERLALRSHQSIANDPEALKENGKPYSRQRIKQIEKAALAKIGGDKSIEEAVNAQDRVDHALNLLEQGHQLDPRLLKGDTAALAVIGKRQRVALWAESQLDNLVDRLGRGEINEQQYLAAHRRFTSIGEGRSAAPPEALGDAGEPGPRPAPVQPQAPGRVQPRQTPTPDEGTGPPAPENSPRTPAVAGGEAAGNKLKRPVDEAAYANYQGALKQSGHSPVGTIGGLLKSNPTAAARELISKAGETPVFVSDAKDMPADVPARHIFIAKTGQSFIQLNRGRPLTPVELAWALGHEGAHAARGKLGRSLGNEGPVEYESQLHEQSANRMAEAISGRKFGESEAAGNKLREAEENQLNIYRLHPDELRKDINRSIGDIRRSRPGISDAEVGAKIEEWFGKYFDAGKKGAIKHLQKEKRRNQEILDAFNGKPAPEAAKEAAERIREEYSAVGGDARWYLDKEVRIPSEGLDHVLSATASELFNPLGKAATSGSETSGNKLTRSQKNRRDSEAGKAAEEEAKARGLAPEAVHQVADKLIEDDKAEVDAHNEMMKAIRSEAEGNGISTKAISLGRSQQSIERKLDALNAFMENGYPSSIERGESGTDAAVRLLKQGNRKLLTKEEAYQQALDKVEADHVEELRRKVAADPSASPDGAEALSRSQADARQQVEAEARAEGLSEDEIRERLDEERAGQSDLPRGHGQSTGREPWDEPGFGRPVSEQERRGSELGGGQPGAGESQRPRRVSALAKADVDAERVRQNKPPIETEAARSDPEVWRKAEAKLEADPKADEKLVDELAKKNRTSTDEEKALLLHRRIALQNELERTQREYVAGFKGGVDAVDMERMEKQVDALDKEYSRLLKVIRDSGSDSGRALRWHRVLAAEDFSLAGMLQRAAAAKGKPLTPEERVRITELQAKITDLQGKLAEAEKRFTDTARPLGLDEKPGAAAVRIATAPEFREMQGAKAAVEGGKGEFQDIVGSYKLKNRPVWRKLSDLLLDIQRFNILTGIRTLGKIATAAGEQFALTPLKEAAGYGLSYIPGLSKIAAQARFEGGLSGPAEKRAAMSFWTEGLIDSWKKIATGRTDLEAMYGNQASRGMEGLYQEGGRRFLDLPQELHAAIKAPALRGSYTRLFLKGLENEMANGRDATSPAVIARVGLDAFKEAHRAIFMEDNAVVQKVNSAIESWRSSERSAGVQALGFLAKSAFPIIKVPSNVVAQTAEAAFGLVPGGIRAGIALAKGIENLKPEQADLIIRQLKAGSIGGAALLVGFLNPGMFGGLGHGRKKDETDVPYGVTRLGGADVPALVQHHPLLMAFQVGASARREAGKIWKKGQEEAGPVEGAMAAALGLVRESPLAEQPGRLTESIVSPKSRGHFFGEYAKSFAVPQFFQWLAGRMDTDAKGEPTKRYPKGAWENIKMGIPAMRQDITSNPKAR